MKVCIYCDQSLKKQIANNLLVEYTFANSSKQTGYHDYTLYVISKNAKKLPHIENRDNVIICDLSSAFVTDLQEQFKVFTSIDTAINFLNNH